MRQVRPRGRRRAGGGPGPGHPASTGGPAPHRAPPTRRPPGGPPALRTQYSPVPGTPLAQETPHAQTPAHLRARGPFPHPSSLPGRCPATAPRRSDPTGAAIGTLQGVRHTQGRPHALASLHADRSTYGRPCTYRGCPPPYLGHHRDPCTLTRSSMHSTARAHKRPGTHVGSAHTATAHPTP